MPKRKIRTPATYSPKNQVIRTHFGHLPQPRARPILPTRINSHRTMAQGIPHDHVPVIATETANPMAPLYDNYRADRAALDRLHPYLDSPTRAHRLAEFEQQTLDHLRQIDRAKLPRPAQADLLLLTNTARRNISQIAQAQARLQEAAPLLPFLPLVEILHEQRRQESNPDPQAAAKTLADIEAAIKTASARLALDLKSKPPAQIAPPHVALRAISAIDRAHDALDRWHNHFDGYDPLFSWWCRRPYTDTLKALTQYKEQIQADLTPRDQDPDAIVGDPIGREALLQALGHEYIPYTPEELVTIAEHELAWVDAEFIKAAQELGFKDDWRAALEHVKSLHEAPGDQPRFVRRLAQEAIDYLEQNDLLTIPPLAKESWRLDMMTPERQLVSPFFLGGETIIVSFPTDTMTHRQKLMSLRSNNRHFSRATVHHELIPGHHLQFFTAQRHNPHRRGVTSTPFWIEGWALYWEFLLYQRGFATTPEDRIGFLFWRKHRCARIIFSLKFHLGQMTAPECVHMLTDVVGHEQSTAEGEVRRSFGGDYPPLYQAAYMLGALQMRALRQELVETGKMNEKDFHDTVLQTGEMPWAVLRALLNGQNFPADPDQTFPNDWRFHPALP